MCKRFSALLLTLCLLLTGCSWTSNTYASVSPHRDQPARIQSDALAVSDYRELLQILRDVVAEGLELSVVIVADYPQDTIDADMKRAISYILESDPIGAYAVQDIRYELGSSNGFPAVSISISYIHQRGQLLRIQPAEDMLQAQEMVAGALCAYESAIVLLVEEYVPWDLTQFIHDYAQQNPDKVMEVPHVSESVYGTGDSRIVELLFTYRTSRNVLRRMQQDVQPMFEAASLYVSGDADDYRKLSQLYVFLMERFDYKVETSITPTYSLLLHGVGDSRAFATVYAAMCAQAGLECLVVSGTRAGEPWTWNIVCDDGLYHHVDLIRCRDMGRYQEFSDVDMGVYVWDYSAYPQCVLPPDYLVPPETTGPTEPTEVPTEPTLPEEPSQPSEPSQPTEPTAPTGPSEPSQPSEPAVPTQPEETVPVTEPQVTEPSTATQPQETNPASSEISLLEKI